MRFFLMVLLVVFVTFMVFRFTLVLGLLMAVMLLVVMPRLMVVIVFVVFFFRAVFVVVPMALRWLVVSLGRPFVVGILPSSLLSLLGHEFKFPLQLGDSLIVF